MGAALLPLAIGGAGIAGGQYMKQQQADAQKAALPQLLQQASLASRPQTLALQAFGPTRADMAQTAMRANQPEMAIKLSGLDRILAGPPTPKDRYSNVDGVGLVDLYTPGGPTTAIAKPQAVDKPSDYITRFNDWKSRNPNGSMMQFDRENAIATRTPTEAPETFTPLTPEQAAARGLPANGSYQISNKTGKVDVVIQPKQETQKYNNDQNKAAGYANTMSEAETRLINLKGFDPTSGMEAARGATNVTASKAYQQYKQAAKDWTLAVLRYESGANVPEQEAEKYWDTYFPQYGDSKEVIAQKAASRAAKLQGVIAAGGGAFENMNRGPGSASVGGGWSIRKVK